MGGRPIIKKKNVTLVPEKRGEVKRRQETGREEGSSTDQRREETRRDAKRR